MRLAKLDDGTYRIPKPEGTWIVCPDTHFAPKDDPEGGHDPKALGCLLRGIQLVKPRGFVHIGDVGEWSAASHWKYARRARPPIQYVLADIERDAEAVNEGMDLVDNELGKCKDRILLKGNHDLWVDNMTEELADCIDPRFKFENLLNLKGRGYAWTEYGEYARLGKLAMYHGGHFGGEHHAAAHLRKLRSSVMYGHHHSYQIASASALSGGPARAWCIGFLGRVRKPFLRGRPTDWSHNFAIIHVEKDGTFHVEVAEIINGRCFVYGKRVEG